jgi:hypothetical protein
MGGPPNIDAEQLSWVFAYGSNMATDELARLRPFSGGQATGVARVEPAFLPGHRLVWNYRSRKRDCGVANVEPCSGRDLPGVALLVNAECLGAIDEKEGHPHAYSRGSSLVTVHLARGGEVDAWVYVVRPERRSAMPVLPNREYLQLLIDGARHHGLPAAHIRELEATPTAD